MSLRHHSLIAWQRADDLFIRLHQLSLKQLPAFEKFELGGQLRRAAFSVAVNPGLMVSRATWKGYSSWARALVMPLSAILLAP